MAFTPLQNQARPGPKGPSSYPFNPSSKVATTRLSKAR